jgi:hypothetical protein
MRHHSAMAVKPIYSFGQGCEGEPLTEFPLLLESICNFRAGGGARHHQSEQQRLQAG